MMASSQNRETASHKYIPALSFDLLTPLYDPLIRLFLRERTFKQRLITEASIRPGHRVLDVGCGTGTLTMMVKQTCPGARVVGLDGDQRILAIARAKVDAAHLDIELVKGMAYAPPFPAASFDRVLTSLVLHHLSIDEKRQALAAIHRLLRPGGELHIVDFGRPHNLLMQAIALPMRLHGGGERMAAHLDGRLPKIVAESGFRSVREPHHAMTPFGSLGFIAAVG